VEREKLKDRKLLETVFFTGSWIMRLLVLNRRRRGKRFGSFKRNVSTIQESVLAAVSMYYV
jgi:hypothetical protein